MECLCQFNDPSMNRMSVAICSILAAKVRMMTNIVHMCDVTMMICQIDKICTRVAFHCTQQQDFFWRAVVVRGGGGDDWKRERDRERSIICLKHNWSIILLHISMILSDRFLSTVFFFADIYWSDIFTGSQASVHEENAAACQVQSGVQCHRHHTQIHSQCSMEPYRLITFQSHIACLICISNLHRL